MTPALSWAAVLGCAAGCYLLKLAGVSVPQRVLDSPAVRRVAGLLPVVLLAALVAVQVLAVRTAHGGALAVDARLAGLGVAVVALLLRLPFLVVVLAAAATAAGIRLLT
ncbi:MAG: branched-chain amino acid transporter AzlD [Marmoricola sp.]|nr:branched-chain amino acid transporter AzlD [Marmoricola sp.]